MMLLFAQVQADPLQSRPNSDEPRGGIPVKDSKYLQSVAEEWQAFRDGEDLGPTPAVRVDILDSWRRSRNALGGKDPQHPTVLTHDELAAMLEEHRELIASATPIMEQYRSMLQSSNSVIVLAAPNGVILHRCGAPDIMTRMGHLEPGVVATETAEGTNGIGVCVALQRPMEVFGPEHYNKRDHQWCCVSSPLRGGKQRFIGVLTVILPLEEFHSHTTGMLTAAARNINDQHHLRDLLSDQEAILELLNDGILVLDKFGGVKAVNKKGRLMLRMPPAPSPLGNIADVVRDTDPFMGILKSRKNIVDREEFLQLDNERLHCVLSSTLIPNDKGVVVTLADAGRMQKYAINTVGAKATYTFDSIVGSSMPIQNAVKLSRVAAKSDITTLILGESGTGKELFAHAIHNAGSRKNGPFVIVNCGALPRDLVQSELFGYDTGAFTGAAKGGKAGKFELADTGTIFLDEIGEMPLEAQVSLLRLIQNGEVSRVGGKFSKYVNVRIIAATNRNLSEAVRQGAFREDLYYRLSVLTITVPALRERPEDIPLLAEHFLRNDARALRKETQGFTSEALAALRAYPWPGNARELENVVERTLNLAANAVIGVDDLPQHLFENKRLPEQAAVWTPLRPSSGEPAPVPLEAPVASGSLQSREAQALVETLQRCRGNVRLAAKELAISRSALYAKMARFGIRHEGFRTR